jgi:hypothetical protein
MAELSRTDAATDPCCDPEQQATCCEPNAKADCCGHGERCGCAASVTAARDRSAPNVDVQNALRPTAR